MADLGGSEPPPLPKRPSADPGALLSDDGEKPAPMRTAPAVPGRPGPGPSRPQRPQSVPVKKGPAAGPSKVLSKPLPPEPTENKPASGKRRLEITVVAARPMSEVGFRDSAPKRSPANGSLPISPGKLEPNKPKPPPPVKKGPPPAFDDLYAVPQKGGSVGLPVPPPRLAKTYSPDDEIPPPVPQRTEASGHIRTPEEDLLIDFDTEPDPVPMMVPPTKPHVILPFIAAKNTSIDDDKNKPTILQWGTAENKNKLLDTGINNKSENTIIEPPLKFKPTVILPQGGIGSNSYKKLNEMTGPKPKSSVNKKPETNLVDFASKNLMELTSTKPKVSEKPKPPISSKPTVIKPSLDTSTSYSAIKSNESAMVETNDKEVTSSPVQPRKPTIIPPPKLLKYNANQPEGQTKSVIGQFENLAFLEDRGEQKIDVNKTIDKNLVEKEKPKLPTSASKPSKATAGPGVGLRNLIDIQESNVPPPKPSSKPTTEKKAGPPRPVSQPVEGVKLKPAPGKPKAPPAKPPHKAKPVKPSLPKRPGPGHPLFHYVVDGPHGIAIYDYDAVNADELSFKVDDVIMLLSRVSEDWLFGKNANKEGMFPQNFIDIIQPLVDDSIPSVPASPTTPSQTKTRSGNSSGPHCHARFDFEGGEPDDLVFQDGDVIRLLERIGDDWMKGELNGKTGNFPLAFVEIIEDLPLDVKDAASEDNHARAIYDFQGHKGEISFKTGDTITILRQVNSDWLFGEINGNQGRFPIGFVDHVPQNLPHREGDSVEHHHHVTKVANPHCIAKYSFAGESEGDLAFSEGDRITLTGHVGDDWLMGILHGKEGLFPAAFADIIEDIDELAIVKPPNDVIQASSPKPYAKAIYDYESNIDGDLSFKIGDIINLLKKLTDDWYVGECNGHTGQFPAGFVDIVIPLGS